MLALFATGITILILAGSVCGIVAVARMARLRSELWEIERKLDRLVARQPDAQPTGSVSPRSAAELPRRPRPAAPPAREEPASQGAAAIPSVPPIEPPNGVREPGWLVSQLKENWMVWLGGFCVALAGIFLAKYSIEQGYLGPRARIALGLITGAALHAAAEWLRRRTGEAHPAFAALAGGGSITLFAVMLASLHVYEMITPTSAFFVLAVIALVTMWLARLHGPVLAAIGIVGAYLVPIFVSSGDGRVLIALGYALVISASALLLMRSVFRPWLWWGFVAGALGWWLITVGDHRADGVRSLYLTAVGYMMLALPQLDWRLRRVVNLGEERYAIALWRQVEPALERLYPVVFLMLAVAQAFSIATEASYEAAFWIWSPLPLLFLVATRHRETLLFLPAVLLVLTAFAWIAPNLHSGEITQLGDPDDRRFLIYLAGTALLFSSFGFRNLASNRFKAVWSSLATLAPLLLLATGYVMTSRMLVSWQWGALALLFAVVYLTFARAAVKRSSVDSLVVWLFFGGHFAFSLAAVAVLHEAQLTLAIAVQMISAAWIINRFVLPQLAWVVKLVVTIVIVRLTLNPWLASYPSDFHWSLWTYGGAALCAGTATWMLRSRPAISKWTEGATLHLTVLAIWAELRYWTHGGDVFTGTFTFTEFAAYVPLFALLGLVYLRRSLASENIAWLYRLYSRLLMVASLVCYLVILLATAFSVRWAWTAIGETPVLNLTLLAFGAPVLAGVLVWRFGEPALRRAGLFSAGVASFVYISLQIRHLWQGTIRLDVPTPDGELYTYSAVWLVMALAAVLGGAWKLGQACYRAGMVLLVLVIGKLFVIDMAGLEGLYRVASFMGLGIGLLGISYLHQRIQGLKSAMA